MEFEAMGAKVRAFVALEVPDEVRERVAQLQERLARAETNLRFVRPENMHLSVKFVGDWEEGRLADLCAASGRAASSVEPFRMAFSSIDVFPHIRRPRVVVLGCSSSPGRALAALHEALEGELAPLGVRPDGRTFKPHLTVARVKGRVGGGFRDVLAELGGFGAGEAEALELATVLSDPRPAGPVYTRAGAAPLGGGGR